MTAEVQKQKHLMNVSFGKTYLLNLLNLASAMQFNQVHCSEGQFFYEEKIDFHVYSGKPTKDHTGKHFHVYQCGPWQNPSQHVQLKIHGRNQKAAMFCQNKSILDLKRKNCSWTYARLPKTSKHGAFKFRFSDLVQPPDKPLSIPKPKGSPQGKFLSLIYHPGVWRGASHCAVGKV